MRHHALPYQAVEGDELEQLRLQLVAVQEALGNFGFASEVRQGAARDTFFKARDSCPPCPACALLTAVTCSSGVVATQKHCAPTIVAWPGMGALLLGCTSAAIVVQQQAVRKTLHTACFTFGLCHCQEICGPGMHVCDPAVTPALDAAGAL